MWKFHQYLYNKQNVTYKAAWGYEFYLLGLKVSLTLFASLTCERSSQILTSLEDKIRIPKRPYNILYLYTARSLQ